MQKEKSKIYQIKKKENNKEQKSTQLKIEKQSRKSMKQTADSFKRSVNF